MGLKTYLVVTASHLFIASDIVLDILIVWLLYNLSWHLQVAIEFPYVLVQTLIYGLIVYAMIAFEWTAAKFFWYIFFVYFTLLYFTFYGMMTVAMTPNYNIAAVVSVSFYGIWNLFAGFLIPRPVNSSLSSPSMLVFSKTRNREVGKTLNDFHLLPHISKSNFQTTQLTIVRSKYSAEINVEPLNHFALHLEAINMTTWNSFLLKHCKIQVLY